MFAISSRDQTSQTPEESTVEGPRWADVYKNTTAKECAARIHKTTSRHFVFTEKVYGTVTESIRRQWRFAPAKETTKPSTV